jgi:hypothetical protein
VFYEKATVASSFEAQGRRGIRDSNVENRKCVKFAESLSAYQSITTQSASFWQNDVS